MKINSLMIDRIENVSHKLIHLDENKNAKKLKISFLKFNIVYRLISVNADGQPGKY